MNQGRIVLKNCSRQFRLVYIVCLIACNNSRDSNNRRENNQPSVVAILPINEAFLFNFSEFPICVFSFAFILKLCIISGADGCDQWLKCNRQIAQKFIKKSSLPACPCTFPLERVKSRAIWDAKVARDILWLDVSLPNVLVYKPGAKYCIRQKLSTGAKTLAVQQCCYDAEGLLLTRGKAAGTPNLVSPYISKELHYKVDLLPWIICKGDWTR